MSKFVRSRGKIVELLEDRRLLSVAGHAGHTTYHILRHNGTAAPSVLTTMTPAQMLQAYGVNGISFGNIAGNGAGQTIAIVDAYGDPTAANDLATFDTQYGLAAPPSFAQYDENGGTSFPAPNSNWQLEESLDVEWAHVIAPAANIILYEASSANDADLIQKAVNTARNNSNVTVISMSFGGGEFAGETSLDSYFTSSHVTFVASTGDTGSPGGYPAYSPDVVAVGGTTLSVDSSGNWVGETAWGSSGGGTSTQEAEPGYQTGAQSTGSRTTPDVAMDANPSSGVPVYSSGSWYTVGGTSLASPMFAGLIAIADQGRAINGLTPLGSSQTLPMLYQSASSNFHDVTSGNNGGFSATIGYDEVTGLGSPIANLLVPYLAGTSPSVTSFAVSPNPVGAGNPITLSASVSDPDSAVTSVAFYRESDGQAGLQTGTGGDVLVGTASAPSNGLWTISDVAPATAGSVTYYALPTDASGILGPSATTNLTVTAATAGSQLQDGGFESPSVGSGAYGAFAYNPTGTPWTFSGNAGISGNGSGFTAQNPNAPGGTQVGFIQAAGASISQQVTLAAGTYSITFDAAQRVQWQYGLQDFQLVLDGAVIGTFTPPAGGKYMVYQTSALTFTSAATHTIQFVGLDTAGGDNTTLLDAVQVVASATPAAMQPADNGFETPSVGSATYGAFAYNPTGADWQFAGNSGISGNGSGFTALNPNAPQGAQVAFLQAAGSSISQDVSFSAGTYQINFDAAQRIQWQNGLQDFEVLVDGQVVGQFTPQAGGQYGSYSTAAFSVAAGTHTIEFLGLDSAGGDNTAFIDAVSVTLA